MASPAEQPSTLPRRWPNREKALKTGYLVSRYPAVSHTFILREVLELRKRGMEIEVASINSPDREDDQLTSDERAEAQRTFYVKRAGVAGGLGALVRFGMFHPVSLARGIKHVFHLARFDGRELAFNLCYLIEALLLAEWVQRKCLNHLHVHFATPAATVALLLCRIRPIGFSLTIHGPDEFYDVPGYYLTQKIAAASFVRAIGTYTQSQLMKLTGIGHWSKFEVVPLGVDPDRFVPMRRTCSSLFEILCVGRMAPAKGQQILLRAFAALRAGGRPVLLRFAGDGPLRLSLEAEAARLRVKEFVCFEGAVNQDAIGELYASADLFVLPSFAEGIPVVLMEAMAMEIPCIATWVNGIPELIRDGTDGLLVPPSDADELKLAIGKLLDDAELRRRLGEAGRRRVVERYNLKSNADRLCDVFHRRLIEKTG